MINYEWIICAMESIPSFENHQDVVKVIHWGRIAKDGDFQSDIFGALTLEFDQISNFINYSELTFDEVCKWLEENLNVDDLNEILIKKIEFQKNPPLIKLNNPWE